MNTFKALLSSEHFELSNIAVEAYFDNKTLIINNPAISTTVDYISATVSDTEPKALMLHWYSHENHAYHLTLSDEKNIAWLKAHAPSQLQYQLNKWQPRDLSNKLIWHGVQ
jgi:hypothetical protein